MTIGKNSKSFFLVKFNNIFIECRLMRKNSNGIKNCFICAVITDKGTKKCTDVRKRQNSSEMCNKYFRL